MAVYTHITETELRGFLKGFDVGELKAFSGIASGVTETNYLLMTTKGRFILTLLEKRTKAEDIPFFAGLMAHLRKKSIPCPDVLGAPGKVAGKAALVTTFLPGAEVKTPSLAQLHAIGKLAAQMHVAGKDFPMTRENTMGLREWRRLIDACGAQDELQTELKWQEENPLPDLPRGVIHADLFPDNVFFEVAQLSGVIDFYFSCNDFFAYDLMLVANAWCHDKKEWHELLSGYEGVRPLTKDERAHLTVLGRRAALRIIATRLYDWLHQDPNALVTPKDPAPYIKILRFHQNGGFDA